MDLKMDKITKILNRIENNKKLKEAQLKEVEADYNLIGSQRKIKDLKREIKRDFWTQVKGFILFAYVILGTIATTSISIAGGYKAYDHAIIFGLGVITIQLGLFLLTHNQTTIRDNYPRFLGAVRLLQVGLLILSIKFNYNFFNGDKPFSLITLILCICFDLTILTSISISADFRSLNFHKKNNDLDLNNLSFLKMLIFNLTAKYRINILRAFNYNKAQYDKFLSNEGFDRNKDTEDLQKEEADNINVLEENERPKLLLYNNYKNKNATNEFIEEAKEAKKEEIPDKGKDRYLLLNAIFENKSLDNICPSVSKLEEITGFSKAKIADIKKELVGDGILTTHNLKTIVNIDSLEVIKNDYKYRL
jgi:hypothetical protein